MDAITPDATLRHPFDSPASVTLWSNFTLTLNSFKDDVNRSSQLVPSPVLLM